ncbi:MAG: hypothetical protein M3M88_02950 [Thermoproteota archaeon]|nr:hypothetical protein [Thermoproteota archaeon]
MRGDTKALAMKEIPYILLLQPMLIGGKRTTTASLPRFHRSDTEYCYQSGIKPIALVAQAIIKSTANGD